MKSDIKKIKKSMEKTLDTKRFEHTMGVAYTACSLAMCYDIDLTKAQIAGMLHDCAKCLNDEKKIEICQKHQMPIRDIEYKNPHLLHAKAGRCLAESKFHIKDTDILNAIENHTTGRPDMSVFEKIIYIADYIEPCREQAPDLAIVRKMAFRDLDQTLLKILSDTLNYLSASGKEIDPMTLQTYQSILEQTKNN